MTPPCAIAQNLHFDVPAAGDVALQVHPRIAEGGAGLGRRQFQGGRQLRQPIDPLHAASAAAADRLDQQRRPDAARRSHAPPPPSVTAQPGTTGTCAASASARARSLSPTASICAAVGPMKITP